MQEQVRAHFHLTMNSQRSMWTIFGHHLLNTVDAEQSCCTQSVEPCYNAVQPLHVHVPAFCATCPRTIKTAHSLTCHSDQMSQIGRLRADVCIKYRPTCPYSHVTDLTVTRILNTQLECGTI
jgi:hypothetical protein